MKRIWSKRAPVNHVTPQQHMLLATQPNAILTGYSPLDIAIANDQIDRAFELLNQPNELYNNHGFTPFHTAVFAGHLPLILEFLCRDKSVVFHMDSQGCTPLHWAAIAGRHLVVPYLVEAGVNVHQQNNAGKTAYQIAHEIGGVYLPLLGPVNNHQRLAQTLVSLDIAQRSDASREAFVSQWVQCLPRQLNL